MKVVLALALSAEALNVARNPNFAKLQGGYLFPEIGRRRSAFVAANPDKADKIISLGIGDTTQPIPDHILAGLLGSVKDLRKFLSADRSLISVPPSATVTETIGVMKLHGVSRLPVLEDGQLLYRCTEPLACEGGEARQT